MSEGGADIGVAGGPAIPGNAGSVEVCVRVCVGGPARAVAAGGGYAPAAAPDDAAAEGSPTVESAATAVALCCEESAGWSPEVSDRESFSAALDAVAAGAAAGDGAGLPAIGGREDLFPSFAPSPCGIFPLGADDGGGTTEELAEAPAG